MINSHISPVLLPPPTNICQSSKILLVTENGASKENYSKDQVTVTVPYQGTNTSSEPSLLHILLNVSKGNLMKIEKHFLVITYLPLNE
jgi:hypothetical protein